ncbi:hypothetical protein ACJX0J_035234, partial [Zea mays]
FLGVLLYVLYKVYRALAIRAYSFGTSHISGLRDVIHVRGTSRFLGKNSKLICLYYNLTTCIGVFIAPYLHFYFECVIVSMNPSVFSLDDGMIPDSMIHRITFVQCD